MKENTPQDFSKLRKKAEILLAKQTLISPSKLTEGELLKMSHELEVCQIELEMQNEEFTRENERTTIELEKYINLYDFGSSGFLTISSDGIIVDLNFVAAKLLCKDRRSLKNTPLRLYIHPRGLTIYNQLLNDNNAFKSDSKKAIELFLLSMTDIPTCVLIDTIASENNKHFSITMVDRTDYNRLEEQAKFKLNDLKEINNYFLCRELKLMEIKDEVNNLLIIAGCEEQYLI